MPLFRDRPVRSIATVVGALVVGHFVTRLAISLRKMSPTRIAIYLTHIADGFHLTQTSVAMLAIASTMFLSEATLLAWRSMTHRAVDPATGGELSFTSASPTADKQDTGYPGAIPFPCSKDDLHCVIEDWFYY
ncbi:hypothetical protein C0995_000473 [Termitomyces sp. Mi166|nr:hypothetical protein C0995_000473 [Termitomyces sp. Mi166\